MNTSIKIIRMFNQTKHLLNITPKVLYLSERAYINICKEHKMDEEEPLKEFFGMKVICRIGTPNMIDFGF